MTAARVAPGTLAMTVIMSTRALCGLPAAG